MVGVSDVVCPWGRPVWGGLESYFNRGCRGFKAGWSYRETHIQICRNTEIRISVFHPRVSGGVFLRVQEIFLCDMRHVDNLGLGWDNHPR